jgi:hypothetical protein
VELGLAGVLGNYFVNDLINVRHGISPFMERFLVTEGVSVGQTGPVSTYVLHYTPFRAELQVLFENLQEYFFQISFYEKVSRFFCRFSLQTESSVNYSPTKGR